MPYERAADGASDGWPVPLVGCLGAPKSNYQMWAGLHRRSVRSAERAGWLYSTRAGGGAAA